MTGADFGLTPRLRTLIMSSARLVLFAIVFQLVAVDHWHGSITEIEGVENSQAHVLHCHGDNAGCADSASMLAILPGFTLTPTPQQAPGDKLVTQPAFATDELISTPDQPPKAA